MFKRETPVSLFSFLSSLAYTFTYMKRGITYIATLITIGLLYFGSLYVVSRPSAECLGSLVNGKTEFMNREAAPDDDVQVPLSSNEELVQFDKENANIPVYNQFPTSTKKEKAVIVILVRNNELIPMRRTLREFEE